MKRGTYPKEFPDEMAQFFRGGVLVTPTRTVYVTEDELDDDDIAAFPPDMRASVLAERKYRDEQEEAEAARVDAVIADWRKP